MRAFSGTLWRNARRKRRVSDASCDGFDSSACVRRRRARRIAMTARGECLGEHEEHQRLAVIDVEQHMNDREVRTRRALDATIALRDHRDDRLDLIRQGLL